MSREMELAQALEACLSAVRSGRTPEEALTEYPHLRAELEPVVRLAAALPAAAGAVPSSSFRNRARARLMAQVRATSAAPRSRFQGLFAFPLRAPRWASAVAASVLAVVLMGGMSVNAAASALPDDPLYSVKRLAERAVVALAVNESTRRSVQLKLIDVRFEEALALAKRGQAGPAKVAAGEYGLAVEALNTDLEREVGAQQEQQAAELAERLEARLQAHQDHLVEIREQVADPAKDILQHVLTVSSRGLDRAAEVHERRARTTDAEAETASGKGREKPEGTPPRGPGHGRGAGGELGEPSQQRDEPAGRSKQKPGRDDDRGEGDGTADEGEAEGQQDRDRRASDRSRGQQRSLMRSESGGERGRGGRAAASRGESSVPDLFKLGDLSVLNPGGLFEKFFPPGHSQDDGPPGHTQRDLSTQYGPSPKSKSPEPSSKD